MKTSFKIFLSLAAMLLLAVGFAMISPEATTESIFGLVLAAPIVLGMIETSDEAKQLRSATWDKMQALIDKRKAEKRAFTPEEDTQYNELRAEFDRLTDRLKELEADEKRALDMAGASFRKNYMNKPASEVEKYSMRKAILAKVEGRQLDGVELEMHQEAVKEARESGINLSGFGIPTIVLDHIQQKRAMSATGQTTNAGDQGGMAIVTEKQGLIEALRPLLVLSKLGVQTMGGLVGNVDLVKGTSTATAWEGENTDANETSSTISKSSFSPKRLAAFAKISKQLLLQSDINFQSFVMSDIYKAIAQAVESAGISGASGSTNPVGILATSGIGSVLGDTNGLAMAWEHIVKLEREIAIDNALMGSLGYLTNHKVKAALKQTKLDSGSGLFIWPQSANELNGYQVEVSNLVPSNLEKSGGSNLSAMIFGNWADMVIGQWGGIDMIVDNITLAEQGQIKLVTNSYWDIFIKRPESFAAMVDIIT